MPQSIIETAYQLLSQTKITYKQIASDTGLNYGWLYQFVNRYKKGQDFHARKIETLIKYLTKASE